MEKSEQAMLNEVRRFLTQISLELEASAAGAREAAAAIPNRDTAWPQVQQMYARLNGATRLLEEFRTTIDEAIPRR
jgi:hypothetical protein